MLPGLIVPWPLGLPCTQQQGGKPGSETYLRGSVSGTIPGAKHWIRQGLTRKELILGISSIRDLMHEFFVRMSEKVKEQRVEIPLHIGN